MKPLVIYHGSCADGFAAAWSIWQKHKDDFDYHPGKYNDTNRPDVPDVTGRVVYLVDFSYKRDAVLDMLTKATDVVILDHHQTAFEELGELLDQGLLKGEIDQSRSGAMITWNYFNPGVEPPDLIRHIQDRDLWKFELPNTRAIQSNVFSYPYDFEIWDKLMKADIRSLIADGLAIERKHNKDINELLKSGQHRLSIAGMNVPACNLPYIYSSEAGNLMAVGEPFSVCYSYNKNGLYLSFRAQADAVDVSKIAKSFGGGGHRCAAGAHVSHDQVSWNDGLMIIQPK